MYYFIANIDRTDDALTKTVNIDDSIREAPDRIIFELKGAAPSYYDDLKTYDGFPIKEAGANYVIFDAAYTRNNNSLFRVGDILTVAILESDQEEGVISEISDSNGYLKIAVESNFLNVPSPGQKAGTLSFAGSIVDIKDSNLTLLKNIQYSVTAIDYTRIFDKALINDTFEDRDARYIVNSFCNTFINYNSEIDSMNYANNGAIQAKWIESGDGNNPTIDQTDYREGDSSGVFSWTFNTGTATFTDTLLPVDVSIFTGVENGQPTKGVKGFWYQATDYTVITNFELRIGSDNTNYISFIVEPSSNDWVFVDLKMENGNITGDPNWTELDYLQIIISQTASSSIKFDGFRILEKEFFRHYPYVETSTEFSDFRINRIKPSEVMQRFADELAWYWYIDYRRFIHLFSKSENPAPFNLDEDSNNFSDLSITYDSSRLVNRQVVMGAEETSETFYSEVKEGDTVQREWITKNKFKNLYVALDDNTSTDTMEVGTNTTTIVAAAHGLSEGDYITNRTQSNAVRKILTVPNANTFTVEAITGQGNGDTFSKFLPKTVAVEGLNSDVGNDYMSNFQEKSIRSAETEPTLQPGQFLMFRYNEVFPILVQRTDWPSVQKMKEILGHTSGIFEGQPITDHTIKTRPEANNLALATLNKYSNLIITAEFSTYISGLKSGQLIHIKDTTSSSRNIDQSFVIQSVRITEIAWGYYSYKVIASSLLFGMLELLQQLLKQGRKIDVDQDAVINNIEDNPETILVSDSFSVEEIVEGDNKHSENVAVTDDVIVKVFEPPFKWGVDPDQGQWNLCQWS